MTTRTGKLVRTIALAALLGGLAAGSGRVLAEQPQDPAATTPPGTRFDGPGQNPASQRPLLFQRLQQALDDLKLSDQQKSKIDSILQQAREDFRSAMQELRGADQPTRQAKMRELMGDLREKLKATLTPEQVKAFQDKVREFRGRAGTATQPGAAAGAMFNRLAESLKQLDLSDDQKTQIKQLLEDTRQKLQELRAQAKGDPAAIREKYQGVTREMRQQLMSILTPEQREKLRELFKAGNGPGPAARQAPPASRPAEPNGAAPGAQATPPPEAGGVAAFAVPTPLRIGHQAPDFALTKLDGQTVQLSSFKGKIVLLVFGSYSSVSFRQRAAELQHLADDYGSRIDFLVVYTRENYPAGQWDIARNKSQGISVEQPKDLPARLALARTIHQTLKLTVPVAVDSMDDRTALAYQALSNAAVLIARDGTILASQKWFEPYALRRAIDQALAPTSSTASQG